MNPICQESRPLKDLQHLVPKNGDPHCRLFFGDQIKNLLAGSPSPATVAGGCVTTMHYSFYWVHSGCKWWLPDTFGGLLITSAWDVSALGKTVNQEEILQVESHWNSQEPAGFYLGWNTSTGALFWCPPHQRLPSLRPPVPAPPGRVILSFVLLCPSNGDLWSCCVLVQPLLLARSTTHRKDLRTFWGRSMHGF